MIDEELLVQHALDSGAAQTNPEVRAALVRSAITRVNSEAAAEPVSERELSEYFAAHRQVYATAASFDVTAVYFEGGGGHGRAGGDGAGAIEQRGAGAVSAAAGGIGLGDAGPWSRAAVARDAIEAGTSIRQ